MNSFRTCFLLFFLPAALFTGCNEDSAEDSPHAHIVGEIVNPINEYVVLLKNNETIDTLYLNRKNRFKYELKNIDAGLYAIKHGSNSPIMYIEPGDSLLLRANTMGFDESLHFSGKGAAKNNFLINTFLKDKANQALIFSHYDFPPEEFAKKTDSIKTARLEFLKKSNEKYSFSDHFTEMAKKNILYEFYDLRERYTYMVNTYYEDFARKIPEDFYDYRKN
ncbi:MAG TPA: hypothetical protein VFI78_04060, partial [Salinimicrobium sp.]|nr:hypothetical protein [Salinimicrobium sp.]